MVRPAPAESALQHPVADADDIAHHPATDHEFAAVYHAATADHKPATDAHSDAVYYAATADHKPATDAHSDAHPDSHSDVRASARWRPARTRVDVGFGR